MFVHGDNLSQKEAHQTKYRDKESREYLAQIRIKYDAWRKENNNIKGPLINETSIDSKIISKRVSLLNNYKNFIDQQHYAEKFDSRSNLHSSVLEEFMYYLFKDIVSEFSSGALIGKSHTFKDIFFQPTGYREMLTRPYALIEKKDHDFAIGVRVNSTLVSEGSRHVEKDIWDLPAVAIECKTYLDKTMLQDASTAADQLKIRNPSALYIVVAERLKLTGSVTLSKNKIDQIYILRKQKNTDREFTYAESYIKNPIYDDVILHLFNLVRTFLVSPWEGGISFGLDRGYLK